MSPVSDQFWVLTDKGWVSEAENHFLILTGDMSHVLPLVAMKGCRDNSSTFSFKTLLYGLFGHLSRCHWWLPSVCLWIHANMVTNTKEQTAISKGPEARCLPVFRPPRLLCIEKQSLLEGGRESGALSLAKVLGWGQKRNMLPETVTPKQVSCLARTTERGHPKIMLLRTLDKPHHVLHPHPFFSSRLRHWGHLLSWENTRWCGAGSISPDPGNKTRHVLYFSASQLNFCVKRPVPRNTGKKAHQTGAVSGPRGLSLPTLTEIFEFLPFWHLQLGDISAPSQPAEGKGVILLSRTLGKSSKAFACQRHLCSGFPLRNLSREAEPRTIWNPPTSSLSFHNFDPTLGQGIFSSLWESEGIGKKLCCLDMCAFSKTMKTTAWGGGGRVCV